MVGQGPPCIPASAVDSALHMPRIDLPQRGLHLEYESHGDPARPAVILIMGLGMQLIAWPVALIEALVGAGLRVVVFDNRDVGLSGTGTLQRHTPPPQALLAHLLRRSFVPPYGLRDLAADTLALADALGIERFHVVGVSLGGMVAQTLAVVAPARVLSLVSIMSNAGPRTAPWPQARVLWLFLRRPPANADAERKLEHFYELMRALGQLSDPIELESLRQRMSRGLSRAYRPEGTARQFLATLAVSDRSSELMRIACPTLILHGSNDPLVPLPAAYHLQRTIPNSRLEVIEGLGHYLPTWSVPILADRIVRHVRQ
jgi:pimeloyl-ACP methyl ester carboxylesterase